MSIAEKYLKPEVIRQIARLDLKARFIVEGFLSGLHSSPYHGFSVEFSEHRKYEPGDEISTIDWAVFGRTDRFYVKKFRAETNTQCHLVVDTSPSMAYGYRGMTKLDYGISLAAALGFLMVQQQDPVGLVTFGEGMTGYLPAKAKRGHLISLLTHLARIKPEGRTEIARSLHDTAELLKRRGLVVIISDLLEDPETIAKGLHHLAFRRHDMIVFHVLDEAEVTFPFEDYAHFQDMETGERMTVDPEGIRAAYRNQVREMIAALKEKCGEAKIDYVQLDTSMPFDRALMSFLLARSRRKGK